MRASPGKPATRWSVLAPVVPRTPTLRPEWNTINISETGMFVSGAPLLRPGSVVDVNIMLAESLEITSRVEVVWIRGFPDSTRNRPAGMGMRFLGIDPIMEAALKAYLARLPSHQSIQPMPKTVVDAPPPPPDLPRAIQKGDKLGRYAIVERIGSGGSGDVFLAEHQLLGRRVALKLLKDEHVHDRAAVRRFCDEARLVNQISHDNIVQITDLVVDDDHVFVVMELLVGQNLSEVLSRSGPLPLSRIVSIGQQLCGALEAVHRAGVVHRNLKPQNVMLVRHSLSPDFAKLLDFGIATLRRGTTMDAPRSLAGTVTPGFMAPEQLAGEPVDARADIYSLGGVLYAMMTAVGKGVPKALDNVVGRCLDRNPNNRPSSAMEISAVLQQLG